MRFIDEAAGLVSSKFEEVSELFSLAKLEAKLAEMSIIPFVVNLLLLFIILMTAWFTTMVMLAFVLAQALQSALLAGASILGINVVFFILFLIRLKINFRRMTFAKTRLYLSTSKGGQDDKKQKADTYADQGHSKKTELAAEQETQP